MCDARKVVTIRNKHSLFLRESELSIFADGSSVCVCNSEKDELLLKLDRHECVELSQILAELVACFDK